MKRILLLLIPALIALLSACNSSSEKYSLKPTFKAGESYSLDYKIDIDQDVMGMNNKMLMNLGYVMKIKNITPRQYIEMDFMYNHMGVNMKSAMFTVSYDSDSSYGSSGKADAEFDPKNAGGMIKNIYGKIFSQLLNKQIQVTLDASGKVKEVKGYREIMNSIKDSLELSSPGNTKALDDMMNEEQINQVFQQTFGTFPNKPVAIGEQWKNEIRLTQNGMPMRFSNTYKIAEIFKKENEAIVDINSIVSMDINDGKVKNNMKMDVSGTQTGKLTIDLATGMIKTGKQIMDIKVNMEVMGQKVPMTMKGTTTLTGKRL